MKILLGIDTSPVASEIVSSVCRTFGPTGAEVIVLSVVGPKDPETAPTPVMVASVAQNMAVLEADQVQTHEHVLTEAERTLRAAGLAAHGELHYGDPGRALVEAARAHSVDMIVIGSNGHGAIRRFVIGSVACFVTHHAPCNVLVVRQPDRVIV